VDAPSEGGPGPSRQDCLSGRLGPLAQRNAWATSNWGGGAASAGGASGGEAGASGNSADPGGQGGAAAEGASSQQRAFPPAVQASAAGASAADTGGGDPGVGSRRRVLVNIEHKWAPATQTCQTPFQLGNTISVASDLFPTVVFDTVVDVTRCINYSAALVGQRAEGQSSKKGMSRFPTTLLPCWCKRFRSATKGLCNMHVLYLSVMPPVATLFSAVLV
jgi:hypothetical protein